MIKLVYCLRKRAEVSQEEFYRYWLNVHGPKVKSVAKALKGRRYIQSHTCEPAINTALVESRGLMPAYDGITEFWWDDAAAVNEAMASPEGQKAMQMLIEDESKFIDFSQSRVFMTTEHVIFD